MNSAKSLRRDVLDPLYFACVWDVATTQWLPASVDNPLPVNEGLWQRVLQDSYPTACALDSVCARFFVNEPDPNRSNRPRLDFVLSISDGSWVRYHPGAVLIWSTQTHPSQAMQNRYSHAAKLQRRAQQRA